MKQSRRHNLVLVLTVDSSLTWWTSGLVSLWSTPVQGSHGLRLSSTSGIAAQLSQLHSRLSSTPSGIHCHQAQRATNTALDIGPLWSPSSFRLVEPSRHRWCPTLCGHTSHQGKVIPTTSPGSISVPTRASAPPDASSTTHVATRRSRPVSMPPCQRLTTKPWQLSGGSATCPEPISVGLDQRF